MSKLFFLCLSFISIPSYSDAYVTLSPSIDRVFYREYSEKGETLNTESGFLPGFKISSGFEFSESIRMIIEGYYGENHIKYDGFLQSGQPYLTKSKMIKSDLRLGMEFSFISHGLNVSIGKHKWDRHILPRNGVIKLSEYYYWKSLNIGYRYSVNDSECFLELSELFDAGLFVDLTEVGYGLISVPMPNGYGFNTGLSYDISSMLSGWRAGLELKVHHFNRSKTSFTGGVGITEPENVTIQLRMLLSHSF